jgi:hypothetical protein
VAIDERLIDYQVPTATTVEQSRDADLPVGRRCTRRGMEMALRQLDGRREEQLDAWYNGMWYVRTNFPCNFVYLCSVLEPKRTERNGSIMRSCHGSDPVFGLSKKRGTKWFYFFSDPVFGLKKERNGMVPTAKYFINLSLSLTLSLNHD